MAFIERLVTKEDQEWLDQFIIFMARENGYGKYLVEDKDRNICMVSTFGQGIMNLEGKYLSEIPIISTLIWNNKTIEIESYESKYHTDPKDYRSPNVVLYSISSIKAKFMSLSDLAELSLEWERVKGIIKEAFFAWQDTTGKLLDPDGKSLRDENGHFIRGRRPFAEVKMLQMAEPGNF